MLRLMNSPRKALFKSASHWLKQTETKALNPKRAVVALGTKAFVVALMGGHCVAIAHYRPLAVAIRRV
jgi:hypothetical protein